MSMTLDNGQDSRRKYTATGLCMLLVEVNVMKEIPEVIKAILL